MKPRLVWHFLLLFAFALLPVPSFAWSDPVYRLILRKAIELAPNKPDGYFWYASCLASYADGVSILTAATKARPTSPP